MAFEIDGIYSGVGQETTINGIHIKVLGDSNSEIFSFIREEDLGDERAVKQLIHVCTDHKLELIKTIEQQILECPTPNCLTKVEFFINVQT